MQYTITEQQQSYRVTAPAADGSTLEWWFDDHRSAEIFVAHDAGQIVPGQSAA